MFASYKDNADNIGIQIAKDMSDTFPKSKMCIFHF